jgi:hypothetical protein
MSGTSRPKFAMGRVPLFPDAACRDHDPELWFADQPHQIMVARKICLEQCPVLAACRAWAMAQSPWDLHGLWGGLSQCERIALHKQAKRAS